MGRRCDPGPWPHDGQEAPQSARAPPVCEQITVAASGQPSRGHWGGGQSGRPETGATLRGGESESVTKSAWGARGTRRQGTQGTHEPVAGETRRYRGHRGHLSQWLTCGREPSTALWSHEGGRVSHSGSRAYTDTDERQETVPQTDTHHCEPPSLTGPKAWPPPPASPDQQEP